MSYYFWFRYTDIIWEQEISLKHIEITLKVNLVLKKLRHELSGRHSQVLTFAET